MGGVCDHINHFGYHIKEMWILKAWGAAMLKGPGENTGKLCTVAVGTSCKFELVSLLVVNNT